jgi:hypothetical protein
MSLMTPLLFWGGIAPGAYRSNSHDRSCSAFGNSLGEGLLEYRQTTPLFPARPFGSSICLVPELMELVGISCVGSPAAGGRNNVNLGVLLELMM